MTSQQPGGERRVRIGFVGIGMGASMILHQLDQLPQFEMAAGADGWSRHHISNTGRYRYIRSTAAGKEVSNSWRR